MKRLPIIATAILLVLFTAVSGLAAQGKRKGGSPRDVRKVATAYMAAFNKGNAKAEAARSADDGRRVLRYDPISGNLVPVPVEELKPGYLYSHFSKRLNRRVWSYVQDNGRFWYALGEGTTQEAWRLDIRATEEERRKKLAEIAPDLYKRVQEEGERPVFARRAADNRWVLAEQARFPTIYNAETGYRWERHSGEYIPISSGPGRYSWAVYRGRYVPAGRLGRTAVGAGSVAGPTGRGCNCR